MGLFKRKKAEPAVVQAPMDDEERRLIAMAEAEMPHQPERVSRDEDNLPVNVLFPRLRTTDGLGVRTTTHNGSLDFRVADDVNAAIEENQLRDMRD